MGEIHFGAASNLRIAIVHYWIVGVAGGEKVVQSILKLYPQADIFTLLYDPQVSKAVVGDRKITASFLQKIPGITRLYRGLLPLMPIAIESLDVSGYDLIISSESGPAKAVLPGVDTVHVCYCHSPMRYIWDQYHEYRQSQGWLSRTMMALLVPYLRVWDMQTSLRVDKFAANSTHVAKRIRKYYGRVSIVIPPPIDVDEFYVSKDVGDYYLMTGRHVGYKRFDLAIQACNALGRRLIITGDGPETKRLKAMAGPTVEFAGQVPFARLKELYSHCRAFLMPGEEDFGIAPVEAMASGRPVIAYGRGGALDSVAPGVSGDLFDQQSVEGMAEAIRHFETRMTHFDPQRTRAHSEQFSEARFLARFAALVERALTTASTRPDMASEREAHRELALS